VTVVGIGATWASSDPTVATIDATGVATARNPGTTTITATSGGRAGSTVLRVADTSANRFTLAVVREGGSPGRGTVTSSETPQARIVCGATCQADYDSGTQVTLTARAEPGFVFDGWRGGGCSGTGTCTVTLTANTMVFATFNDVPAPPPTLRVTRQGTGTGAVTSNPAGISCGTDCTEAYPAGTTVRLTATPAGNSTFQGWGGACSGTGDCTVRLTADTMVTASFALRPVTLQVTRQGTGTGAVTSNPAGISCGTDCTEAYPVGTTVRLTARPGSGSAFRGWGGDCSGTGTCTLTLTANRTVSARFDDVTPPTMNVPGAITRTATSLSGVVVTFNVSATDNVDPSPAVSCLPRSGSLFSIGLTTVTCRATDNAGNVTSRSFGITVLGLPLPSPPPLPLPPLPPLLGGGGLL